MSNPAQNERRIFTGVEASGTVPVEYRFSHAKNGNRHLVVVFANLTAPGEYGWSNGVLDKVRANVLWIRDLFDGENSYYLCKGMDFGLEQSVAALISRVMGSLGLTPDECTLFGSSKGGSAALYFGLKYGFRNIVASVPQFLIGTYVRQDMPGAARMMMGEVTEQNVRVLDAVLPDVVRNGSNRSANIYLVSSPQDEQFPHQVEPFLSLFQGYENFNFICNDSPLITGHGKVSLRNLPALMSVLNLLVDGIAPRFGMIRNGFEQPDRDTSAIDAYLADTSQVRGDGFPRPVVLAPAANDRVSQDSIRFVGTAPGAVRISFWENGKHQGSAPVGADGSWTWEREKPWGKGRHVVRLFAADAANYQSERTEVIFTAVDPEIAVEPPPAHAPVPAAPPIQVVAPARPLVLAVTAPAAGQQVPGPTVTFAGYAPGAVRVEFQEGGVALGTCNVPADGSWTWDAGWAWTEGGHFVEAIAVDGAGNASGWITVPFGLAGYTVPAPGTYFTPGY